MPVVEDAAHALGARWRGRPVGSLADVTAFSFYATKNLTTGEGGAAVTDDDALAERMTLLSLHGMNRDAWKRYTATGSWYYEVVAPGYKYNLSDVLAAIGLGQLERFDEFQRRRASCVARYHAALADVPEVRAPGGAPGRHARLAPVPDRARAGAADAATGRASSRSCAPRTSAPRCTSSRSTSIPHFRDTLGAPRRAASRSPRTPTGARSRCRCSRA